MTLIVVLVAGAVVPVWAATPTEGLRRAVDHVIDILRDRSLKAPRRAAERRAALERAVEPVFDFDEMARRSLGLHWRGRSDQEHRRFTELFQALLERAYVGKVEGYAGEHVRYLGESVDGDYATVRTAVVTARGTDVPVEYRMLRRQGRWLVYDVLIEGVSLVENYRTQFNAIIAESFYAALMERMQAKVAQGDRG